MNTAYFSLVVKGILPVRKKNLCIQFMNLQELTGGEFGITEVDRLYPLKPKNPI